ncbi:MAG: hypothetical protein KF745_06435 [Phycisphaeraceae bacterium]|nr:hypothetical protein [Phycisphaeraceae bacterium]
MSDQKKVAGISSRRWREGIGLYLMGMAIGCLLLGLLWMGRAQRAGQAGQGQAVPSLPGPGAAP